MLRGMPDLPILSRSPELMTPTDTCLLVVDLQTKLLPVIDGGDLVLWNISRLLEAAKILDVRAVGSEQYPAGLGTTLPEIASHLGVIAEKLTFSCAGCEQINQVIAQSGTSKVLIAGIESHVCVQQTALDLIAAGLRVYIAADAVGARYQLDHDFALRRLESAGATLTTTEAVLFEWCQAAGTPEFKEISRLVRQQRPTQPVHPDKEKR